MSGKNEPKKPDLQTQLKKFLGKLPDSGGENKSEKPPLQPFVPDKLEKFLGRSLPKSEGPKIKDVIAQKEKEEEERVIAEDLAGTGDVQFDEPKTQGQGTDVWKEKEFGPVSAKIQKTSEIEKKYEKYYKETGELKGKEPLSKEGEAKKHIKEDPFKTFAKSKKS